MQNALPPAAPNNLCADSVFHSASRAFILELVSSLLLFLTHISPINFLFATILSMLKKNLTIRAFLSLLHYLYRNVTNEKNQRKWTLRPNLKLDTAALVLWVLNYWKHFDASLRSASFSERACKLFQNCMHVFQMMILNSAVLYEVEVRFTTKLYCN